MTWLRELLYKLEAGSYRRTQLVEEAQTMLVVLEYIWMCLSDDFVVSSGDRQLLDNFVAYHAYLLTYFGFNCALKVQF